MGAIRAGGPGVRVVGVPRPGHPTGERPQPVNYFNYFS